MSSQSKSKTKSKSKKDKKVIDQADQLARFSLLEQNQIKFQNLPVSHCVAFEHSGVSDGAEVGIEIELEGTNLPTQDKFRNYWVVKEDNSLREVEGHPGREYVLREPLSREKIPGVLELLFNKIRNEGSSVRLSHRCSVHVHLNIRDWTILELYKLFVLYTCFEDLLVNYSGPDRRGNLFCLRSKDAEYLFSNLAAPFEYIRDNGTYQYNLGDRLYSDNLRYLAMNVTSIPKFGSLEFRSMRGQDSAEPVKHWVSLLLRIYDAARGMYRTPTEILQDSSGLGIEAFTRKVLGSEWLETLRYTNWERDTRNCIRLAQEIVFAADVWEKLDTPVETAPAPKKKKRTTFGNTYLAAQVISDDFSTGTWNYNPTHLNSMLQSLQMEVPYHPAPQPAPLTTGINTNHMWITTSEDDFAENFHENLGPLDDLDNDDEDTGTF